MGDIFDALGTLVESFGKKADADDRAAATHGMMRSEKNAYLTKAKAHREDADELKALIERFE